MELYSRVERIGGNGVGYRDIVIHEMTEAEIRVLKESRWLYALMAFCAGFITCGIYVMLTLPYPKF